MTRIKQRWILAGSSVLLVGGALAATNVAGAQATSWTPSPAQERVALALAHQEAETSVPAGVATGNDAFGWPANVRHVEISAGTRRAASRLIDNSAVPDDRDVVVVRLVGDFVFTVTGPKGSAPSTAGHVMTVVADATTGDVLDVALLGSGAPAVPNTKAEFDRP